MSCSERDRQSGSPHVAKVSVYEAKSAKPAKSVSLHVADWDVKTVLGSHVGVGAPPILAYFSGSSLGGASKSMGSHFGVCGEFILEPILVGIGSKSIGPHFGW